MSIFNGIVMYSNQYIVMHTFLISPSTTYRKVFGLYLYMQITEQTIKTQMFGKQSRNIPQKTI